MSEQALRDGKHVVMQANGARLIRFDANRCLSEFEVQATAESEHKKYQPVAA